MFGGKPRKQYYWELRDFRHCGADRFKEALEAQRQYLYLFKKGIPDVIVRVDEPLEKIHSWTFAEVEVLQRLNDNPRVFHWKHLHLPMQGELVLPLSDAFNRLLREQVEEALPKRTKALERWINSPLDDVFLVTMKSQKHVDCENAVLQVKSLNHTRYKNYFTMRSWRGPSWERLLDTADLEGLQTNSSYGLHLEETNHWVSACRDIYFEERLRPSSRKKAAGERAKDKQLLTGERSTVAKYVFTDKFGK